MPNVSDQQCSESRREIFSLLRAKTPMRVFCWVVGLLLVIALAVMGSVSGMFVAHAMDGPTHIDPRYPPLTVPVFKEYQKAQDERHQELLREIRKRNGTRAPN